mmetsp:Transcript_49899/g.108943  ORF Transcript_49899/g.108943 Transcript_49899/m.108943 type:complete len:111 (-) Transcript_49899:1069-1401(-)
MPSVSFATDIEGNFDWWRRFCDHSEAIDVQGFPFVKPGHIFVFGGDLFDRGPGDLRLGKELVRMKDAQPGQVVLLMGNRVRCFGWACDGNEVRPGHLQDALNIRAASPEV